MPTIQECSIPFDNLSVFIFENFTSQQLKILFDLEINEISNLRPMVEDYLNKPARYKK